MRKLSMLVAIVSALAACDIPDAPVTRTVPLHHERQRLAQQHMWMLMHQPRVMDDLERNSVSNNSITSPRMQFECRPRPNGRFICD